MSNERDAVDHVTLELLLADVLSHPGGFPKDSGGGDTWADDYVDPWLVDRSAATQRSQNFDAWVYTASRAYESVQPARNSLRSMTNDSNDLSDTFSKPGIARGRARYRETHRHNTLTHERLVHEIHALTDEQNRLESYRTDVDPGVRQLYSDARARRIKNDLGELLNQLFAPVIFAPVIFEPVIFEPTESLTEPSDAELFSERTLAPVVELLTRSFDRAPGAPNNG
jgi:hypothetical protein